MRKKNLRTFLLAALLCALLPVSAAFADSATVNGSDVNLRSGPGTGYDIIDCLPKGAEVEVIDCSNSAWYAIRYDGQEGFMSSRYLTLAEPEQPAEQPQSAEGSVGYVNAMYVNFRSAPSTENSAVLGQYSKNKSIQVFSISGDWAYISIDGQNGYMFASYVTLGSASGGAVVEMPQEEEPQQPEPTQEPEQPEPTQEEPTVPVTEPPAAETPTQEGYLGHITGDYVRFRTGPSTSHSIINSYNKNKQLRALSQEGDWVKVFIDGELGYVFAQYVYIDETPEVPMQSPTEPPKQEPKPEEPKPAEPPKQEPETTPVEEHSGYITGNDVRFRAGASMSSEIIGTFYYGNGVTIKGVSGDWTAVNYNGKDGFVYSQYVAEGSFSIGGNSESESSGTGSVTGSDIANFALQYVGYNYCWGGASPDTGFDCSGLVYYTYKHFGYTLNRVAADQANNGRHVDADELQPGDILCFYSSGSYIGHAGIYIGDGKFVHASNSTTGVIITELGGYYSERGFEARRVIG